MPGKSNHNASIKRPRDAVDMEEVKDADGHVLVDERGRKQMRCTACGLEKLLPQNQISDARKRAKNQHDIATHCENSATQAPSADAPVPNAPAQSAASSTVPSAANAVSPFVKAVELANANLRTWKLTDMFTSFYIDGEMLHARDVSHQRNVVIGRLVAGTDLPLLIPRLEGAYEMETIPITIMDACKLAAHGISGKRQEGIERLVQLKALQKEQLALEKRSVADGKRAHELLTRPAVLGFADAYKECTTLALKNAMAYVCGDSSGQFVCREGAMAHNPEIAAAVSSNLVLHSIVEALVWDNREIRAVKVVFEHKPSGSVFFKVWLLRSTLDDMQKIPGYKEKIEACDLKKLPFDRTLMPGDLARGEGGEGNYEKVGFRAWDPLRFEWPNPERVKVLVEGPARVPPLTHHSDSLVEFVHALKATSEMERNARPAYNTQEYVSARKRSYGLMLFHGAHVPASMLCRAYNTFCEDNRLVKVEQLEHWVTQINIGACLERFNIVFEKEVFPSAIVHNVALAPRAIESYDDILALQGHAQGTVRRSIELLPPEAQKPAEARKAARLTLERVGSSGTETCNGHLQKQAQQAVLTLKGPNEKQEPGPSAINSFLQLTSDSTDSIFG